MQKSNMWLTPVLMTIMSLAVVFSVIYFSGCSSEQSNTSSSQANNSQELNASNPLIQAVISVQEKYTDYLMSFPNVVGVGVGLNENNIPAIIVFTSYEDNSKSGPQIQAAIGIPKVLENIPVIINNTGAFQAFNAFTQKYSSNIPIGVSVIESAEGCAAGTIGCMVKSGTTKYILSCNHVLANENKGAIGSDVVQPGIYDAIPQCSSSYCNKVAKLSNYVKIYFGGTSNYVDAAIASVSSSNFSFSDKTPSGYYGFPPSSTTSASLRMNIRKVGRTTGYTTGTVSAINVTVNVQYSGGVAKFVGQIATTNSFCSAGDSGSLVITNNSGTNPTNYSVGLLFAGTNSGEAILNPIGTVLNSFGVSICNN